MGGVCVDTGEQLGTPLTHLVSCLKVIEWMFIDERLSD